MNMATVIDEINPAFRAAGRARPQRRFAIAAAAFAIAGAFYAAPAAAGQLGNIDLLTRPDGRVLPALEKDGRRWVVGTPGQEYAIRVCNTSGGRVLAVMSVDGVNVVSGDTASPAQSGYVLERVRMRRHQRMAKEPRIHRSVLFHRASRRLRGAHRPPRERRRHRRRIFPRTAAARCVEGLGGESSQRAPPPSPRRDRRRHQAAPPPKAASAMPLHAATTSQASKRCRRRWRRSAPATAVSEPSYVQTTRFDRESATPNETFAIHYDRRENLIAMGILPPPSIARSPNPFPGWKPRFVPDPPVR